MKGYGSIILANISVKQKYMKVKLPNICQCLFEQVGWLGLFGNLCNIAPPHFNSCRWQQSSTVKYYSLCAHKYYHNYKYKEIRKVQIRILFTSRLKILTNTNRGSLHARKVQFFLTLSKRGGGHSHVQKLCCKFCIIKGPLAA